MGVRLHRLAADAARLLLQNPGENRGFFMPVTCPPQPTMCPPQPTICPPQPTIWRVFALPDILRQFAEILPEYCRPFDTLTIHSVHASHKGKRQQTTKGETMSKLEELKTQLTLKFIAGRRPSDAEMVEVERLRHEIAELENAQRRDTSWCKS